MSTEQPTHITVERIEIPEDVRRDIAANLRLGRYLASVERLEESAQRHRGRVLTIWLTWVVAPLLGFAIAALSLWIAWRIW